MSPATSIRRLCAAAAIATAAVAVAGCGEDDPAEGLTAIGGGSLTEFRSSNDEVILEHPREWVARNGQSPMVAQVATGGAQVSIFAYPRTDNPETEAEVEEARGKLIRSLGERAPGFLVIRTEIGEVDGSPSVEIRGRGLVAGKPVESRSVHVYKDEVEWVVDAFARPSQFERANEVGFGPMIGSLELSDSVVPDPGTEEDG